VHRVFTERDVVVAESLSQAAAERDDALHQADALDKKLGALEKESQDALDQAKTEAQEREEKRRTKAVDREDKLEGRLRTLAEALSGKILCHASHFSLALAR
jgi:F0F1-type ATP synthase membrane subunit b/b'